MGKEALSDLPARISRRYFGRGILALSAATCVGVALDEFADDSEKTNGYPEGFFEQDLIFPSENELRYELSKTVREYTAFRIGLNESDDLLLSGETTIPISGRTVEMTFKGIHSIVPSETVLRIRANGQEPRLATLIVSPDPEDTTILFDPFETKDVQVEIEKLSEGPVSLTEDQFEDKIEFSVIIDDCMEQDIIDSTPVVLPRESRWEDLRFEAPYKRLSVTYYLPNGERIDLNRLEMLCEIGGTRPIPLYERTRVVEDEGEVGPGRTTDMEWDIEVVRREDGSYARVPRIQLPNHKTGTYNGIYQNNRRAVAKIRTRNNNFVPVTDLVGYNRQEEEPYQIHPELSKGFFLYKPRIISHSQYEYMYNRPNRFAQWRSLEQLIELGLLQDSQESIIVDFASYHEDIQALLEEI